MGRTKVGRRVTQVNESLVVSGSSSAAAIDRVMTLFGDSDRYVLSHPTSDVVQLASTKRSWLRSRSSLCTVRAVAEPQRLIVTITGEIGDADLDALRAAALGVSGEQVPETSLASFQPEQPASPSGFVPPQDWFVTQGATETDHAASRPHDHEPMPIEGSAWNVGEGVARPVDGATVIRPRRDEPVRSWHVTIGGTQRLELTTTVYIGRAPESRENESVQLVAVDDPAMSKTHLMIGVSNGEAWAVDRHSSNGTEVEHAGASSELCPGERTPVPVGAVLVAGDTRIVFEATR